MRKANIKWTDLIWVLPPILIYFASEFIRGQLGANGEVFPVEAFDGLHLEETNRRIFFISSSIVFVSLAITIFIYTLYDFKTRLGRSSAFKLIVAASLIIAAGVFILKDPFGWFALSYEIFGIDDDPKKTNPLYFMHALELSHPDLPAKFNLVFGWVSAALIMGVTSVVLGVISCLSFTAKDSNSIDNHMKAMSRLEHYLFLSAILMIAGLVFYMSYMYWPSFIVSNSADNFKIYNEIVRNLTIFTGITFSLMIASYYLPIRSILIRRHGNLQLDPVQASTEDMRDNSNMHPFFKWIGQYIGLSKDQKAFYSYMLKIISPVLVAWLSQYLHLGGSV